MKIQIVSLLCAAAALTGAMSPVMAETKFTDDMKISTALNHAITAINKSDYKDMELTTTGGKVSGEFVKLSGSVLILKQKSGNINIKHNKDKIQYILVDVNNIIGISFFALD